MTITIRGRTGSIMDVRLDGAASVHPAEENDFFSWTSATKNIDDNDVVILVTNDSTSKHLHITDAYAYSDVSTEVDFYTPAFATFTGDAITGVALNRTAVTIAPATALGDSNDTLANIFATLHTNETEADQFGVWLNLGGLMILGYQDSIAINLVAASTVANGVIMGYFHDNHS